MRKITIVDIAKELDISPGTVSRALKGIGRMNYETRNERTIVFKSETEGSIQLKEDD